MLKFSALADRKQLAAKKEIERTRKRKRGQERDREDKTEKIENYMNSHTVHEGKTGRLKYNSGFFLSQ